VCVRVYVRVRVCVYVCVCVCVCRHSNGTYYWHEPSRNSSDAFSSLLCVAVWCSVLQSF